MNTFKIIFYILEIVLGILMIIYGAIDDSPGGQFLGLAVLILGSFNLFKINNKEIL